jgi:hypothetical protein
LLAELLSVQLLVTIATQPEKLEQELISKMAICLVMNMGGAVVSAALANAAATLHDLLAACFHSGDWMYAL